MKPVLRLATVLSLIVLFANCEEEPEINPNEPVDIPDQGFLAALIEVGLDTDDDGKISYAEAYAVDTLVIYGTWEIIDLTGIEAFINLQSLFMDGTDVSEINLSKNTKLEELIFRKRPNCCLPIIGEGHLETIDISENQMLKTLVIANQKISHLDISNNILLTAISIDDNPDLAQVCVWTMPFPPAGVEVDSHGSANVHFTTDCNN